MDAPAHFKRGGFRLHEIPFKALSGEAVVVNITAKARKRDGKMRPDMTQQNFFSTFYVLKKSCK